MPVRCVLVRTAAGIVLTLLASACTGASPSARSSAPAQSPCTSVVHDLLATTQRYIDGFGVDTAQPRVSASASATAAPSAPATSRPAPITEQAYADAVTSARSRLSAAGCETGAFQQAMASGLQKVTSHGAIAKAVLAQLRAGASGTLPTGPVTTTVGPQDDLAGALAGLPDGSTLVLRRGAYRLPDTLVLLRSVTLRGAGPGATELTSDAGDASLLVMTDQPVTLEQLAVRRTGSTPGSVVITGPTAKVAMHAVRVSGARADASGAGGVGVLLTANASGTATATNSATSFTASDSTFADNAAAGVAAGGTHIIDITASRFDRNRQCGVCFLGSSAGTVSGDTFTGNGVGVVVASPGRTVVRESRISGGDVGIQATDQAKPVVRANTISGTARASMVFVGAAAGRVDANNCSGDRSGIAVARTAYPLVGTNDCRVTLGQ